MDETDWSRPTRLLGASGARRQLLKGKRLSIKYMYVKPRCEMGADSTKSLPARGGGDRKSRICILGNPRYSLTLCMMGLDQLDNQLDRPFFRVTKEMTPSHRLDLLTDATLHYARKSTDIESSICSRWDKAEKAFTQAQEELSQIISQAPGPPGPPGPIKVKDITKDSCIIQWSAPDDDGGADVFNYIVEKKEAGRVGWATVTFKQQKNTYRITNLVETCTYYFRVIGENKYGIGEAVETEEPICALDPVEPPEKPKNLTVEEVTPATVSLAWKRPDWDGGSRISGYLVEYLAPGEEEWTKAATARNVNYTVFRLDRDQTYRFRVTTLTELSQSVPAELPEPITCKEEQRKLSCYSVSSKFVHVQWKKPIYDGGARITGYVIEARDVCSDKWVKCHLGEVLKLEHVITDIKALQKPRTRQETSARAGPVLTKDDLQPPTITLDAKIKDNKVQVHAGDKLVISGFAGGKPVPTMIFTKGRLVLRSQGRVSIDQKGKAFALCDGGGAGVTNYVIEKMDLKTKNWKKVSGAVRKTTFKIPKLIPFNEYQFRVSAQNMFGVGDPATTGNVLSRHPFDTPGPPVHVQVREITRESLKLLWSPPENDGGSEIVGFLVERKEKTSVRWERLNKDRPHKGTKANVIYRLKCEEPNCNNTYIGETSRPLKVRYKEHCRPSANGYSSAIFHHLQHNQGHSFKLESMDVLDRETRWWERGVKEAIYERMYNPTLNREGGLRVDLSGTWDLALPAPRTDNT
ncbi:Titin-like [Branchiostoma belcheri]|nr:Titin-like [Branchiostoma belcheri]